MTNYMFVNFYFRKSIIDPIIGAVYVRVTVNGERITLGAVTSVSGLPLPKSIQIEARHWDEKKKRVRQMSPQALVINNAIAECQTKLDKIYAQHQGYSIHMNARQIKLSFLGEARTRATLQFIIDAFLNEKKAIGTKKATVDTYSFKFRPLQAFLSETNRTQLLAEEFTPGVLREYRTYLITQRNNIPRSADKNCQAVKTVLLWAAETERIRLNPLLHTRIRVDKTPNTECLTQEEVERVRTSPLEPYLRRAADCFVFACYTGLAYKDLENLTEQSIQLVEGVRCLVGKRQKTGTDYCIPITYVVAELLNRHGVILPLPTNQCYNLFLKQIGLLLDIKIKISSHTARKTFADWCINELNMSEEATIVAMGQKSAKELQAYRKTRPKRLLSEFPSELLQPRPVEPSQPPSPSPFRQIYKAS